jgi:hypothetical protein
MLLTEHWMPPTSVPPRLTDSSDGPAEPVKFGPDAALVDHVVAEAVDAPAIAETTSAAAIQTCKSLRDMHSSFGGSNDRSPFRKPTVPSAATTVHSQLGKPVTDWQDPFRTPPATQRRPLWGARAAACAKDARVDEL